MTNLNPNPTPTATPDTHKARGSMVPLKGLQLVCCAAVVGIGVHVTAGLFRHADATTRVAVSAFEVAATTHSVAEAAQAAMDEIKVVVKQRDTLDAIFRRMEFSLTDLADILTIDSARQAFARLRPGDELTLATREGKLVAIEKPLSISQVLKLERDESDGFVASVQEVPVTRHVITTTGRIESSLFAAGMSAGLSDLTTMELAEIFRWDVDFVLDLRDGDSFKLIYEKREAEGGKVEDGDILAAEFVNDGKTYRAVRYEVPGGKADYYTPQGQSLRKAFLKTPVKFSRVSSVFNPQRRHPVLNTIRAHRGVDYAAPSGTPVYAAGAGRVQFRGVKGGFGNVVELAHSGSVVTRYGHLSRFAKGLSNGQKIGQGDLIGYVGMTGLATGPHLHFEFIEAGRFVDPQQAIRRGEPGPPVPATMRAAFDAQIAPLMARLDAAPAPTGTALVAR